ncbi:MAG: TonB-dependent receptor [Melioribacteraceae bacterium]|nr:MAG: TonB-dependent receptor [Melioribacteraceae bacterium]
MEKIFSKVFRKSTLSILIYCVLAAVLFLPNTTSAQKRGQITGRVFDLASKEYLPGANVRLEGTTYGAATNISGIYRIANIPPGDYKLIVSYIGYDNDTTSVSVPEGHTLNQDMGIKASDVKMEEVTIFGLAQGQTKALSIQKTADNIKNVISEEGIEKFPDINAAEALQRLPGVSVQRDQGEGRYVQIRGTSPQMNAMKVNGEDIPSPEGGERTTQMDIIPANQLATIEVVKALTPDMDGNAIGGAVNLVTKSALDYEKPVLNATVGGGYADISGKGLYQGNFNYGTRFGANNDFGIMVGASYLRSDRGSHNNEMEWGNVEDPDENEIPWALENLSLRNYDLRRDRMGFSTSLDYRPDNNNSYSLRAIYNDYLDIESRNELIVEPDGFLSATDATEAEIVHEMKARDQNATLYSIMFRGENHFGGLTLDYSMSYNYAQEKEDRHFEPKFEMDETPDLTWNLSDVDNPKFTFTNFDKDYYLDASNFVLDEMEFHDNLSTNTDIIGSVNFKVPYSFFGNQAEFKLGSKVSMKNKDRKENIWVYEWDGDDDILKSQFTSGNVSDLLDGNYNFGPLVDVDKVESFFNKNKDGDLVGELSREDSDAATYDATEDIYAFYLMTTINFDNLMILAGIRDEISTTSYTGNEVIFDDEGDYVETNKVSADKSHNHILPSVHLKYTISDRTNLRAAFTSGLARPHYEHMVPFSIVLHEDEEIERGNADLVPTTAYGFDLLAEHYFSGIGVVSGGVFYKILEDAIYPTVIEQEGGIYDGYEIIQPWQPEDAEPATILGFEINWQQQLSFLPGFLDGFGIYANYTYTKSTADMPGRENATLPGQAGSTANLALSYQKSGFTAQISLNYQDSFISEVGEDSEHDIYYKDHIQFDFSANQEIFSGFNAYLQLVNLNNAPLNFYLGNENRPIQREYYSWWLQAGFKYNM